MHPLSEQGRYYPPSYLGDFCNYIFKSEYTKTKLRKTLGTRYWPHTRTEFYMFLNQKHFPGRDFDSETQMVHHFDKSSKI